MQLLSKSAGGIDLQAWLLRLASCCAAPALDLDFLLAIMHEKQPLDWEAVLSSDVPLKVVASCLDTLQPVILESFTDAKDLEICLRASANVPEVGSFPLIASGGLGFDRLGRKLCACMSRARAAQPGPLIAVELMLVEANGILDSVLVLEMLKRGTAFPCTWLIFSKHRSV